VTRVVDSPIARRAADAEKNAAAVALKISAGPAARRFFSRRLGRDTFSAGGGGGGIRRLRGLVTV